MTSREQRKYREAMPDDRIDMDDPDHEWLYLKEAWARLPKGTDVSLATFRVWCREGRYGIVAGYIGGQIVVRADTIPAVRPIE